MEKMIEKRIYGYGKIVYSRHLNTLTEPFVVAIYTSGYFFHDGCVKEESV